MGKIAIHVLKNKGNSGKRSSIYTASQVIRHFELNLLLPFIRGCFYEPGWLTNGPQLTLDRLGTTGNAS